MKNLSANLGAKIGANEIFARARTAPCLAIALLPALLVPAGVRADAMDDQALAMFDTVFAQLCGYSYAEDGERGFEPRRHSFTRTDAASGTPQTFTVFEMYCGSGTYNVHTVYLINAATEYVLNSEYEGFRPELRPLSFAAPVWDTSYSDAESTVLDRIDVVGWRTLDMLVNAQFDPETGAIWNVSKWRGLADAGEVGRWELDFGGYRLVSYAVDPTFDGDFDPTPLYTAPEAND